MNNTCYMHSTTAQALRKHYDQAKIGKTLRIGENVMQLGGLDIVHCEYLRPTTKKWVFPHTRFVTYEKSDERWCRFFGIGYESDEIEEWGEIYMSHCEDPPCITTRMPRSYTYITPKGPITCPR